MKKFPIELTGRGKTPINGIMLNFIQTWVSKKFKLIVNNFEEQEEILDENCTIIGTVD